MQFEFIVKVELNDNHFDMTKPHETYAKNRDRMKEVLADALIDEYGMPTVQVKVLNGEV